MKAFTLEEICSAVKGELVGGGARVQLNSVSTDTRTINSGELFIALRGENYDGHNFLQHAVDAAAGALIVEEYNHDIQVPVIKVNDTLKALQDLARYNREQFDVPVVGITGSSGKTTTKDMISSVLAQKYKVLKTMGNFNNEIGLPLTLLQLDDTYSAVVVEMAMRGFGEVDTLCEISKPTAGVVTNISEAHLERLGSVQNIARCKAELLDHIPVSGFAVLNGECPYLYEEAHRCKGKIIYYDSKDVDLYAEDINCTTGGNTFTCVYGNKREQIYVPLNGIHNIHNALAAIAVGRELQVNYQDIARGLRYCKFSGMRMEVLETRDYIIINDAYNANPHSMVAALQALDERAGGRRAIAVLGDMLELGSESRDKHTKVGMAVKHFGIQYLITLGELAEDISLGAEKAGMADSSIYRCSTHEQVQNVLDSILKQGDIILVKGSRGKRMEYIADFLLNRLRVSAHNGL